MFKKLIILALVILTQACATIHQLGRVDLPSNQVAILEGPTNLHFVSVTGMEENLNPSTCTGPLCGKGFQMYIPEGQRSLKVYYSGAFSTSAVVLEQYFEAGKTYELILTFGEHKLYYNIVEKKT